MVEKDKEASERDADPGIFRLRYRYASQNWLLRVDGFRQTRDLL